MQKVIVQFAAALLGWTLFLPVTATAQGRLEKPVFKDGDWWKVKLETLGIEGSTRSGLCYDMYDQYLIKIVDGRRRIFVGDNFDERIRCAPISWRHLGSPKKGRRMTIPLPMAVGEKKSFRAKSGGTWHDVTVKVKSHKKPNTLDVN